MSKLFDGKKYKYVEHCNWNIYTPFLGTEVIVTKVIYNVIHNQDNVVHLTDNVVVIR